jgi:hypothetical protein
MEDTLPFHGSLFLPGWRSLPVPVEDRKDKLGGRNVTDSSGIKDSKSKNSHANFRLIPAGCVSGPRGVSNVIHGYHVSTKVRRLP